MPHGSMEIMNDTIEAYTTCLYKVLFTVINMKTKGVVQQKHKLKYIYEKFTVH